MTSVQLLSYWTTW